MLNIVTWCQRNKRFRPTSGIMHLSMKIFEISLTMCFSCFLVPCASDKCLRQQPLLVQKSMLLLWGNILYTDPVCWLLSISVSCLLNVLCQCEQPPRCLTCSTAAEGDQSSLIKELCQIYSSGKNLEQLTSSFSTCKFFSWEMSIILTTSRWSQKFQ